MKTPPAPPPKKIQQGGGAKSEILRFGFLFLLLRSVEGKGVAPRPMPKNAVGIEAKLQVVPVTLQLIDQISSLRVYAPKDLRSQESMKTLWKRIEELLARHPDGLPQLDPIEDMQITDESFRKVVEKVSALEYRLSENSLWPRRKESLVNGIVSEI